MRIARDPNGLFWPSEDKGPSRIVLTQVIDLERVYPYVKKFDVVIQAGGHIGVWPKALSAKFRYVYTFEPDRTNFACMQMNIEQANVFMFNAALGGSRGNTSTISPEGEAGNMGALCVNGGGPTPMLRIDDFDVGACDLLQLDIEGYEVEALAGGVATLQRHKPVLMIEEKGLTQRYGHSDGDVRAFLDMFGYKFREKVNRDSIYLV